MNRVFGLLLIPAALIGGWIVISSTPSTQLCSSYPRLAWRFGTGEMQTMAVYSLAGQVKPGMSSAQVMAIFGVRQGLKPLPHGETFSAVFPARPSAGQVGIHVYFISNSVANVVVYD